MVIDLWPSGLSNQIENRAASKRQLLSVGVGVVAVISPDHQVRE